MPRRLLFIVILSVLLGGSAGCGASGSKADDTTATSTTSSTTTTTLGGSTSRPAASDADKAACGPLKKISDLDKARNEVLTGADWSVVKPKLIDVLNQGVDAYDRAIPRAPNDLAGELTKLRQFTESSIDYVRASSSLDDFGSKVTADPAAQAAGAAAVKVDTFAQSTCGFSTGNN